MAIIGRMIYGRDGRFWGWVTGMTTDRCILSTGSFALKSTYFTKWVIGDDQAFVGEPICDLKGKNWGTVTSVSADRYHLSTGSFALKSTYLTKWVFVADLDM